jgi:hypothetical protein
MQPPVNPSNFRWLLALSMSALLLFTATMSGCDDETFVDPDATTDKEVTGAPPDNDAGITYQDFGGTGAPDQLIVDLPEYTGQDTGTTADTSGTATDPDASTAPDVIVLQDGTSGGDTGPAITVSLTSVFPIKGPSEGGLTVEIDGEGFDIDTEVFFGAVKAPLVTFISPRKLSAETPAASAGVVSVRVVNVSGSATLPDAFTYADSIRVTTVDPSRSPTTGGVPFTVRGAGFSGEVSVSVGGRTAPDMVVVNDTTIAAVTPPGDLGVRDVRVTSGAGTTLARGAITYYAPTSINDIFPSTGRTSGGDSVVIEGAGFDAPVAVSVGGKVATITNATTDSLTITTPANPPGAVDVVITSANGIARAEDGFLYLTNPDDAALTVADIAPDFGPAAGGNAVVVRGTGFSAGTLGVTVGGAPATIIDSTNSSVRVSVPAGTPGSTAGVTVTVDGTPQTLPNAYTYLARFDSVDPPRGDTTGGQVVTLRGEGFKPGSQVYFGTQAASAVTVAANGSTITATTPPGQGGYVHVSVRYSGYEVTLPDAFYYTEALAVYAINPRRGSQAGGTLVTLTGRGFAPDLAVTVDGATVDAGDVSVIDPYTATFRTPAHAPGIVEVTAAQGAEVVSSPDRFTYFNPGNSDGGGWGSTVTGALNVTVLETSGTPVPEAFVIVGVDRGTDRQGVTDVNGQITFSDLDLTGVQSVTASKRFMIDGAAGDPPTPFDASATVNSINSENVTLLLDKPSGGGGGEPPTPPGPGFIFGDIRGVDKVSLANDGNLRRRAVIITSETLNPAEPNPDPGPQSILDGNGSYRLVSRLGDVAVIAMCGVYNTSTGSFTPLFFDMQRFVFVTEASEQRVDLDCDKPMNLNATVKLVGAPIGAGTDINAVFPILNIGPEGYLAEPWAAQGTSDSFLFPSLIPLTGEFQDMSYMIQGISVAADGGYPQSTIILDTLRDFTAPIEMAPMMPIPRMVTPLDNTTLQDGHVEWNINNRDDIDMYGVYLFKPAFPQPQLIWQIFLPGSATGFDLPQFTGLTGAPPRHTGQTYMLINAIKMNYDGFDFDDFTWRDSSSANHRSWSESLIIFNMP